MMWLLTECKACESHGVAPCEDAAAASMWRPLLCRRCPDCGEGPRRVRGPFTVDQLPMWALDLVPDDWPAYLTG
jgi:hypothetical protein